ncbi:MAG: hypothetical protein RI571_01630 [Roseovarius sp.]|nr:hypothetical protein [Roseovarius sp.]
MQGFLPSAVMAAVLTCAAATATADTRTTPEPPTGAGTRAVATPPPGHQGQWWTHPRGCEYSRAGRPGETVWFVIINTRRPGCPTYIVGTSPYDDMY